MQVKITATYSWIEEVTEDDLKDIMDDADVEIEDRNEDMREEAFQHWKGGKEDLLNEDASEVADDATCKVDFEVMT